MCFFVRRYKNNIYCQNNDNPFISKLGFRDCYAMIHYSKGTTAKL